MWLIRVASSPGVGVRARCRVVGRVCIYDGLRETDIERAMLEQFSRVGSMMFIRVKPTPVPHQADQTAAPTRTYYQDDGC